jgi:MFS superfamily sulfate permease-like transporter
MVQAVLTAVVVVGLAIDAYVHFDLASAFRNNKTSTLSEADLFRLEAVLAVIAAVALLVRPRRYTAAFAFLVAAGGTAAVVVYRYVDVGAFGPIPDMYDPFWAPAEKNLSLVAEVAAAVAALALFAVLHLREQQGSKAKAAEPVHQR